MNMKAWGKAILREMLKLLLVILVHIHMKLEDNDHVLILLQLIKLLLGLLIQLKNSIPMQQNDKIEKKMRDHVRLCFISISIRNKCCHIWQGLKKKPLVYIQKFSSLTIHHVIMSDPRIFTSLIFVNLVL